ncbi:MAG: sugar transferase [Microbacteriaceae bacterium]
MPETPASVETPSQSRTSGWRRKWAWRLRSTDAISIVVSVIGARMLWLGMSRGSFVRTDVLLQAGAVIPYWLLSLGLIVSWFFALEWAGSRDPRVLGYGSDEYRRVLSGTLFLFGGIAILSVMLDLPFARSYVVGALPLGAVALIGTRWVWRQRLIQARDHGEYLFDCVVLGSRASAQDVVTSLRGSTSTGYRIIGVLSTDEMPAIEDAEELDMRVMRSSDTAYQQLAEMGADIIILSGGERVNAEFTRRLSWQIEESGQSLVLVPSLTGISGRRLHTHQISGVPLIQVEAAELTGGARIAKRIFDVLFSTIALIVLSPVLLLIAAAIRMETKGPVIFAQQRIGFDGNAFRMLKFRSMVIDAEARLAELSGVQDAGNDVLFKVRDDPRVTRVGRILRRWSLDELPQFVNVFLGTMSLVGPRPPLQAEVEKYEEWVHRRFKVKPGITGLWQVSGRSELSWQDTVRLDLYYVENWSLLTDMYIIIRTVRVVLVRQGAY